MVEALKCGVSVQAFWGMTPRETAAVIEAAAWRFDQEQRGRAWLAWHVAVLSRMKKIPPLQKLLANPKAKALSGEELEKRRQEFGEMKEKAKKWLPVRN
jgi:hypothetical protein